MIAKAKAISHGANAIRYSVDKDKAEIVITKLLQKSEMQKDIVIELSYKGFS